MDTTHDSACYRLQVNGHTVVADGASKGEPGDTVVVWPAKGAPQVARRLARCAPYDKFYFADLSDQHTFAVSVNKVRLIHAVMGGPVLSEARA